MSPIRTALALVCAIALWTLSSSGTALAQPRQPDDNANPPAKRRPAPAPVALQPTQAPPAVAGPNVRARGGVLPSRFGVIPGVVGVRPAMRTPPLPPPVRRGPARHARRPPPPPPEPPGVEVGVSPVAERGRYLYWLDLRPSTWAGAEVIADRRLLRFDVVPAGGGRPLSCKHASAPRFRAASARAMTLSAPWREWIDIRDYCWGRALAALDRGAHLEPRYGFVRARRGEWVARRAGEGEAAVLVGPPLDVAATGTGTGTVTGTAAGTATVTAAGTASAPAPVAVAMRRVDASTDERMAFTISLRSVAGTVRIYPHPNLFRFVVDGPTGRTECGPDRQPLVPIVDFYRTITRTRTASATLDSRLACPDAFREAGVYDVTPVADLPYDGARYELEVVTGSFVGATVPVRIRAGRHPFAPHPPETLPPARPADPLAPAPAAPRASGHAP